MDRLRVFEGKKYDLVVIGGGITGACVARDAALRGLTVALFERGDFGGATSANSLKTIHGGLRYLQDLKPGLVRKMIQERKAWLRTAPHLVHPLPCILPTYKNSLKHSKWLLGPALMLNDIISLDRNRAMDASRHLPGGMVLSRQACLERLPGLDEKHITGGILWYDAQMRNSERLLLAVLLDAHHAGAAIRNYAAVKNVRRAGNRITGVTIGDARTQREFEVEATVVVNAAGPWTDEILGFVPGPPSISRFPLTTAMNLVTRQIVAKHAMGLLSYPQDGQAPDASPPRSRVLFIAPWHDYSIVGTIHAPFEGSVAEDWVAENDIIGLLREVNEAYPGAKLEHGDVYQIHQGFLPGEPHAVGDGIVLQREGAIYDMEEEAGLTGLLTVVGVKYTTARHLAERVVNGVMRKLGRAPVPPVTARRPVFGGEITNYDTFLATAIDRHAGTFAPDFIQRLVENHGTAYPQILRYIADDSSLGEMLDGPTPISKAEIVHAIRGEMAQTVGDVVLRRTELGAVEKPPLRSLVDCARLMATELDWDRERLQQEIGQVEAHYDTLSQSA